MFVGILLFIIGMFIATQNTQSKIAWPLIIVGLVLIAVPVRAQHVGHPPEHMALHDKFYKTWMMPDHPGISCCHDEDCKPAEAHMRNGQWYARQEGDTGDFTPIPPQKVEQNRDTPDGRNHLCGRRYSSQFSVFCFIAGSGG